MIDDEDKCPRTPGGATVNLVGCWVLKGVLFSRGQRAINSQVYPALDEVVSIPREESTTETGDTRAHGQSGFGKTQPVAF